METTTKKQKTKFRTLGGNKKLPFEQQVMWVLRNYDKMAKENRLLRHYLDQIPADIIERYNVTACENIRLNRVVSAQEQEIKHLEKKVEKQKEHIGQYEIQLKDLQG